MVSTQEIAEILEEALDNIEGGFTEKQLWDALGVMEMYPFVEDKIKNVRKFVKARDKLEGK